MRMTRRAKVARLKGNVIRKSRTRDNVVRGALKGQTLRKRQRMCQEGNKGQLLYLWKERTTMNGIRGWSSGQ
jgi:hypothetical protein